MYVLLDSIDLYGIKIAYHNYPFPDRDFFVVRFFWERHEFKFWRLRSNAATSARKLSYCRENCGSIMITFLKCIERSPSFVASAHYKSTIFIFGEFHEGTKTDGEGSRARGETSPPGRGGAGGGARRKLSRNEDGIFSR